MRTLNDVPHQATWRIIFITIIAATNIHTASLDQQRSPTIITPLDKPSLYRTVRDNRYYLNRYGSGQGLSDRALIKENNDGDNGDYHGVEKRCLRCRDDDRYYSGGGRYDDRRGGGSYDTRRPDYYDRYDDRRDERRPIRYDDRYNDQRVGGGSDRYDRYDRYDRNRYGGYEADRDRRPYDRYDTSSNRYDSTSNRYDSTSNRYDTSSNRYDTSSNRYDNRGSYDRYDYRDRDRYNDRDRYDDRRYDSQRPSNNDRYDYRDSDRHGYDNRNDYHGYRPWDETTRGSAGWDNSGRGYYFATGKPEPVGHWSSHDRGYASNWNYGGSNRDDMWRRGASNGWRDQGNQDKSNTRPYHDQADKNASGGQYRPRDPYYDSRYDTRGGGYRDRGTSYLYDRGATPPLGGNRDPPPRPLPPVSHHTQTGNDDSNRRPSSDHRDDAANNTVTDDVPNSTEPVRDDQTNSG